MIRYPKCELKNCKLVKMVLNVNLKIKLKFNYLLRFKKTHLKNSNKFQKISISKRRNKMK